MKTLFTTILIATAFLFSSLAHAQSGLTYQVPPEEIEALVNAPQTPAVSVNPKGDWMVLLERSGYPSIEELAQPELKLAGLRINPRTNGPSRAYSYNGLTFKSIIENKEYPVTGLPEDPQIENVSWSPDGQTLVFTISKQDGIELWMADFTNGKAEKLTEAIINDVMGYLPYRWISKGGNLVYKTVPDSRGEAPSKPLTPKGPIVQETTGKKAPVRTFQDLLSNPHDEDLFDFYTTSQLYTINLKTKVKKAFGEPGIFNQVSPSPDGKYVFISEIVKPYSYIVPYYRFAQSAKVYNMDGNAIKTVADIPVAEDIPKGFGAVRMGPRNFSWRSDKPSFLYWIEAQDEGDPNKEAEVRDKMFFLTAPFRGVEIKGGIETELRYGGITWSDDNLAIIYEWWWNTRQLITSKFKPGSLKSKKEIFEQSFEDRYNDPGNFQTTLNEYGEEVLLKDYTGTKLFLIGEGASPEGNRPFVREYDPLKKETKELWRSEAPYYEYPYKIVSTTKKTVLTRRESTTEPPNYFLRDMRKGRTTQLTEFTHPFPQLAGIEKQVIKYKREDDLDLEGDLYLPLDYNKEDGPLPVIMWAYPDEFKSSDAAGQVSGSPYEFIRLGWWSPLYFLTQGYAIFNDPSMPVVGEGEVEPNDNFRNQLVMNAAAAINKLTEMGIADSGKVAVGGHSYGAFMTANLLAHSDLFAAGIARSGAYNRTLTPFGFQSEERIYWEAPEIYYTMSPFMHADKINEPMLMIHGDMDNNSGTFPMQSERMFAAIKGLGGNSRLVMLPYESHGYRAKESILHMLWEMDEWLKKYVKQE